MSAFISHVDIIISMFDIIILREDDTGNIYWVHLLIGELILIKIDEVRVSIIILHVGELILHHNIEKLIKFDMRLNSY